MSKPKITAKQEGGDDGYCYVVRINGREFVDGLGYREVPHYKEQALRHYNENFHKYGGTGPYTPPTPKRETMTEKELEALLSARRKKWKKLHRQVYQSLNNALANGYDMTWETIDAVVTDIKDYDAGLAGIPTIDLGGHINQWQSRRRPKIKFTNTYWNKLRTAIQKKKLGWKKLDVFMTMLSRHDYSLQSKSWNYKPHPSVTCCDLALGSQCVCTWSSVCPVHGDMHVGTHD